MRSSFVRNFDSFCVMRIVSRVAAHVDPTLCLHFEALISGAFHARARLPFYLSACLWTRYLLTTRRRRGSSPWWVYRLPLCHLSPRLPFRTSSAVPLRNETVTFFEGCPCLIPTPLTLHRRPVFVGPEDALPGGIYGQEKSMRAASMGPARFKERIYLAEHTRVQLLESCEDQEGSMWTVLYQVPISTPGFF